jgi:hypothetical protein
MILSESKCFSSTPQGLSEVVVSGQSVLKSVSPSVLDCELVNGTFWVFDILMQKGEDLRLAAPLWRRQILEEAWPTLWSQLMHSRKPLLSLKKTFLQNEVNFGELRQEMEGMPSDGLIIQPAWNCFDPPLKFKEVVTIDLILDADLRGCARDEAGNIVSWAAPESLVFDDETLRQAGHVVEFVWNNQRWHAQRLRSDRSGPNAVAICEEARDIVQQQWNTWSWLARILATPSDSELKASHYEACVWEALRQTVRFMLSRSGHFHQVTWAFVENIVDAHYKTDTTDKTDKTDSTIALKHNIRQLADRSRLLRFQSEGELAIYLPSPHSSESIQDSKDVTKKSTLLLVTESCKKEEHVRTLQESPTKRRWKTVFEPCLPRFGLEQYSSVVLTLDEASSLR